MAVCNTMFASNMLSSFCHHAVLLRCVYTMQVGSILFTAEAGQSYQKGEELGYFAFGGSTCIALFQHDKVVVDEDIVSNR